MRNAVQLCLAANNILLMRKWNHNFLLLAIALAWKWHIASLLKIFIYKQTRSSNDKTIIIKRMIQDFTLDPSRPRSPSAPGGPTGPWHINIQETSRQKIIETPVWILSLLIILKFSNITQISHFRDPKTLTFKMRLGADPFLWKWVLNAWEWKMISISKAEHLPSFWNRGPGELGNGLLRRGGRGLSVLFEACVTRDGYLRGERAETCLKLVILRLQD